MKKTLKRFVAAAMSLIIALSGIVAYGNYEDTLAAVSNVANGKSSTCYTTSNANTGSEGFCYVGNGFSAINMCNESYSNGNNLLGKTATTDEVAVYLDLQADYYISSVKLYQGSTNSSYPDSFCTSYSVYYSTETVDTDNEGNITWVLAGSTTEGKIYNGSSIQITETTEDYQTSDGDEIVFDETYTARSVKIVFDPECCMGTGTTEGTVSIVSLQVYGEEVEESTEAEEETTTAVEDETTEYADETTAGEENTDSSESYDMNILFIGNSMTYYNNLSSVVQGLAEYYGYDVNCTAVTNGGQNLIYQSTASNVLTAIEAGGYDVVILQDIVGSFDGDNLMTGADALMVEIYEYNPEASVIFYEPWPVRSSLTGDSSLLPYFTASYIKAAEYYDSDLAPAGEVFYTMYVDEGEDYYISDDKHPAPLGTFVSAASIYYALFPDSGQMVYDDDALEYITDLINDNIAYSGYDESEYDVDILNKISEYAYGYTKTVNEAIDDGSDYTSVAGSYDDESSDDGLSNVASGKNSTCYTTSNANTGSEGFCYVGNGFSAINMCNESYTNGNNLLGKTATTDEVAVYLDLQDDYEISYLLLYQGSTNSSYPDSYCQQYEVYYSDEEVNTDNEGDITWYLAGSTDEGKIYNGSSIVIDETGEDYQTDSGDRVDFESTYTARSIKIVFDPDYCMGTGSTEGTVSIVSLQLYGTSASSLHHVLSIDGQKTMVSGGINTLPELSGTNECGYYNSDAGCLYSSGDSIDIESNLSLETVSIDVSTTYGASVKLDTSQELDEDYTGSLRFRANVSISNTEVLENAELVEVGMLISSLEGYQEDNGLYVDSSNVVALSNSSAEFAYNDSTETYYFNAVISNIAEKYYTQKYVAGTFAIIKFYDGSTEVIYSDDVSSDSGRSLASVASTIVDGGYSGITSQEAIDLLTFLASYDE